MNADDRRRARAITKAQRDRRERNVVTRAVQLLVGSSESVAVAANGGWANMKVAPGEIVRNGDTLYMSSEHPGQVTTKPQSRSFAIGVAVELLGAQSRSGGVTVRLHHRG